MDQIPTEVVKHCLSFLDDKTARIARLACMAWFEWIRYSNFNIYFARPNTLPQMIDRLSKYQHPIDLTLKKPCGVSSEVIIENISKLTQLRSFTSTMNSSVYIPTDMMYPLTTLVNLEALHIYDTDCPVEILHHFTRMRKAACQHSNDLGRVLKHCKNIESISDIYDNYLDALPTTIKKLEFVSSNPNTVAWIKLSKLTNLKKLRYFSDDRMDLTGITWLESLKARTVDIYGLDLCKHLTQLSVQCGEEYTVPELPNLEKLKLDVNGYGTHMANLTSLTFLEIRCPEVDLTTLGTSLQNLDLSLVEPHDFEDITHLIQLTQLRIEIDEQCDLQPINNLTNLESLILEFNGDKILVNLSNLQKLTCLYLMQFKIDANTVQHLTKLQYLHILAPEVEWDSLSQLHNLTYLHISVYPKKNAPNVDCTVIENLPLKQLLLYTPMKNEAAISKLTQLESLTMKIREDYEILAALKNLTKLDLARNSSNMTGIHLTLLTSLMNLQILNIGWDAAITEKKLKAKLTRLFDININID